MYIYVMKKILSKIIGSKILGNKSGLLSLISEKTGKISFKRVGATMVIAWIVNSVNPVDMGWIHAFVIVGCLTAVALPKVFTKD